MKCASSIGIAVIVVVLAGCVSAPSVPPVAPPPTEHPPVPAYDIRFPPYEQAFSDQWQRGETYAREILALLQKRGITQTHARFVTAIVFPELTRYNRTQDFFEAAANSLSVRSSHPKNYSIGVMQMTPQFAVDVERELARHTDLQELYRDINYYGDTATTHCRRERIKRIRDKDCQISYLLCFLDVFLRLYETDIATWQSDADNIYTDSICLAYAATAYNAGMYRGIERYEWFMTQFGFPYGGGDSRSHWNYRTIAESWWRMDGR
ncbi:MAG: hypothetical protein IJ191_05340 [Treponema sp.]|nr:hypothetical protein [Treponema sp.]